MSSFKTIARNNYSLTTSHINLKIWDGRSVRNFSKNVYAKFRCAPLRIKKTLGIFRELIPRRRTTRVAFWDPPTGSRKLIRPAIIRASPVLPTRLRDDNEAACAISAIRNSAAYNDLSTNTAVRPVKTSASRPLFAFQRFYAQKNSNGEK